MLKPTKRQIHGGLLGTLAAIGIPMAIELASKIFGRGLQTPRKAGGKDCKLLEKLELALGKACRFAEAFFMATSPLLWYMGGAGTRSEGKRTSGKRASAGGQQPIQPSSPSWEQFFKGEAKMERYSPV